MDKYGAREFELSFRLNNSAFEDDEGAEIARILRQIANDADCGATDGNIRDANGNTVGTWSKDDLPEDDEDEESEDDED